MICPRCTKDKHGVHTCTPTPFVRDLEQRLEYALRNLAITEKARQEEMAKRDELTAQLSDALEAAAKIGAPNGR